LLALEDAVALATKSLLSGAVALALLVAPAMLNVGGGAFPAPADHGYDWSGWYAGANLGSAFGPNRIDIDPMSPGADLRIGFVSPQLDDHPAGALGGFQTGVNWQAGNLIYGVETDLSRADIGARVVGPFLQPPYDFETSDSQRLDWLGTLRARAGFAAWDRSLIFLTGGLAYGRASVSTFAIDTSADLCGGTIKFCVGGYSQRWLAGLTVGAGWEYELAPNWSMKVEYLYYNLGKITNSMTDILTDPDVFQGSATVQGNIVRVGLNYRFH
jgi:outer membrane immunogenic protein